MNWRYLHSPPLSGLENMKLDEFLYRSVQDENTPPVLRLYTWKSPCISLGNSQHPEKELNLSKVYKNQIEVVKRITGGRAVFHNQELTYSVVARHNQENWTTTKESTYEMISRGLLRALSAVVPDLTLGRAARLNKHMTGEPASPCFSSTARSEIIWQGKKLVGSAQRRSDKMFIQHGSILLSPLHQGILDYQNFSVGTLRSERLILSEKAVSISEILDKTVEPGDITQGFARRFFSELGLSFTEDESGDWEQAAEKPGQFEPVT